MNRLLTLGILGLVVGLVGCAGAQIQPSEDKQVGDRVITTRVESALTEALGTHAASIKVQTFKQVVLLSGMADRDDTRTEAVSIAQSVDGVELVKDHMDVR